MDPRDVPNVEPWPPAPKTDPKVHQHANRNDVEFWMGVTLGAAGMLCGVVVISILGHATGMP